MPTFSSVITFGDLCFLAGLLVTAGVGWARLQFLETSLAEFKREHSRRADIIEEVVREQSSHLQRVIGAFELHVRMPHGE